MVCFNLFQRALATFGVAFSGAGGRLFGCLYQTWLDVPRGPNPGVGVRQPVLSGRRLGGGELHTTGPEYRARRKPDPQSVWFCLILAPGF